MSYVSGNKRWNRVFDGFEARNQLQSGAAAAPARETNRVEEAAPAQNTESFPGAEKRRSPRYKCEGSAEVREDGRDVRTWPTFTDVGLHGCYVEAQTTIPQERCCT